MAKEKFEVIKNNITIEGNTYLRYGIKRGSEEYKDLTSSEQRINEFCNILNKADSINSDHFKDMVEDFIEEEYSVKY